MRDAAGLLDRACRPAEDEKQDNAAEESGKDVAREGEVKHIIVRAVGAELVMSVKGVRDPVLLNSLAPV